MWKNVLVAAVLPTTFELGLFVIGCEPAPSCPTTHVVLVWFLHILAEAACKHIVELAKAEAAANPYCSEDMLKFARIRLCDAERGVHSVLKQVGLIAPVPVTELNLGPGKLANFPCIKLSDWMLHLLNTKRFARQMAGVADFGLMQSVLTEFWRRYEAINSGHAVFEMARNGTLRLDRCVPFFHTATKDEATNTCRCGSCRHTVPWVVAQGLGCRVANIGHQSGAMVWEWISLGKPGQRSSCLQACWELCRPNTQRRWQSSWKPLPKMFLTWCLMEWHLMMVTRFGWSIWRPRGTSPPWSSWAGFVAHSVMSQEPHGQGDSAKEYVTSALLVEKQRVATFLLRTSAHLQIGLTQCLGSSRGRQSQLFCRICHTISKTKLSSFELISGTTSTSVSANTGLAAASWPSSSLIFQMLSLDQ